MRTSLFLLTTVLGLSLCSACEEEQPQPTALQPPELTLSQINGHSFTAAWEPVADAESYAYILNSSEETVTKSTSVEFTGLEPGEYSVRVKSVSGNPDLFTDSEWVEKTITLSDQVKTPLPKPEPIIKQQDGSSFTVAWTEVENAVSYAWTLNDSEENSTEELEASFTDLEPGDYTFRVKAIADAAGSFSNSEWAGISVVLEVEIPEDWLKAEAYLGTDEENGYFPYNSIFIDISTVEAKEIRVAVLPDSLAEEDIRPSVETNPDYIISDEALGYANGEGVTLTYSGLEAEAEYTVAVFALNNYRNLTDFHIQYITTEVSTEMPEELKAWLGTYTVTSSSSLIMDYDGSEFSFTPADNGIQFDISIEPWPDDPKKVAIKGWSRFDSEAIVTAGGGSSLTIDTFLPVEVNGSAAEWMPVSGIGFSEPFDGYKVECDTTMVSSAMIIQSDGTLRGMNYNDDDWNFFTIIGFELFGRDADNNPTGIFDYPAEIPSGELKIEKKH